MDLDPRSVANLIIEEAVRKNARITNLALQKILYFVHGRFLVEGRGALVAGSFEAWQYGPVSLPVYEAFKEFGASPITAKAKRRHLITKEEEVVPTPKDPEICERILEYAAPFFKMAPGRLVELSHADNGPWDRITRGPNGGRTFGLRITNKSIEENFRHHKVAVNNFPKFGEPHEESSPY
jgi:uncharacterized phage-associated protein